ncbi:MAG TPA: hypothetical protein VEQ58_22425 [Polyangiaceae bacterium]|nr:hypothetical protein [Polyangiaceae bacterium]
MKLIRLPSGPLACVFPIPETTADREMERGKDSGVYRAFSGSVEADGESEAQAIQALDAEVRRLSVPPPAEITEFEQARAANDVSQWDGPKTASAPWRQRRLSEFDTLPAPASSSRG